MEYGSYIPTPANPIPAKSGTTIIPIEPEPIRAIVRHRTGTQFDANQIRGGKMEWLLILYFAIGLFRAITKLSKDAASKPLWMATEKSIGKWLPLFIFYVAAWPITLMRPR